MDCLASLIPRYPGNQGFRAPGFTSTSVKIKSLPETKEQLQTQLKEGIQFLFDSVERDPVVIKLYFRFRGTENPVGNVIKKYEKSWLENASKSVAEIMGISKEQSVMLAELMLTLRLGFAHRFATSSKPKEVRETAKKIFQFIEGMVSV